MCSSDLTSGESDGFDVQGATGKELDARFGDVDGYPRSGKVDERRAFVTAHLEAA